MSALFDVEQIIQLVRQKIITEKSLNPALSKLAKVAHKKANISKGG